MKEHFCSAEKSMITYEGSCNWCGESEGSMTQDDVIEMAEQAGMTQDGNMWFSFGKEDIDFEHEHLVTFANLVAAKATEEANAKANASWTLMCNKMVALEREAVIQIIKETPFSNWFQADVIEAIRARGEQA